MLIAPWLTAVNDGPLTRVWNRSIPGQNPHSNQKMHSCIVAQTSRTNSFRCYCREARHKDIRTLNEVSALAYKVQMRIHFDAHQSSRVDEHDAGVVHTPAEYKYSSNRDSNTLLVTPSKHYEQLCKPMCHYHLV